MQRRSSLGWVRPVAIILLVFESAYFLWFAYGILRVFRGAQNTGPSDPLPPAVWANAFAGLVFIGIAIIYGLNFGNLRKWLAPIAVAPLLFGFWGIWTGYPIMSSFSAAMEGDAVAMGVLSSMGFVAIGALVLADGWPPLVSKD